VALDDLGAGFSSLNLLTELRPDFVKMDMHLIRGVDQNDYKARILGSLIDLAHKLEIPVVAEGVETVAEWQWLRAAGADLVQGYLFAKPGAEPPLPVVPGTR
jgi:EAL domain-containing protein (putative c-di-GMP-specific phosphodiesterase class I)